MNLRLTFIPAGGWTWQFFRSQNDMYPLWPKTSQLFVSTFTSSDHSIGNSHYMFTILIKGLPIHLNNNPEQSLYAQNQPRCWMHEGESLLPRVSSLVNLIDKKTDCFGVISEHTMSQQRKKLLALQGTFWSMTWRQHLGWSGMNKEYDCISLGEVIF